MNRLKALWNSVAAVAVLTSMPLTAGALETPSNVLPNGFDSVLAILNRLLQWLYTIFFIIAVMMIIWAAFSFLTAGGDEEKIAKARTSFIYAVVAIAVAVVAASVRFVVQSLFT